MILAGSSPKLTMEKEKFDVKISGEARRMLIDHVFFLANVNPAAAEKLRTDMIAEIQSLENFPERFPYLEPDNRKNPYRKMFVPKWYLVLYMIEENHVFVDYILDCRQDYQWLLTSD